MLLFCTGFCSFRDEAGFDAPPRRDPPDIGGSLASGGLPTPIGAGGAAGGSHPSMMTFKQFLTTQDDSISDEDAIQKYQDYKLDYKRQQLHSFFIAHKDEEWYDIVQFSIVFYFIIVSVLISFFDKAARGVLCRGRMLKSVLFQKRCMFFFRSKGSKTKLFFNERIPSLKLNERIPSLKTFLLYKRPIIIFKAFYESTRGVLCRGCVRNGTKKKVYLDIFSVLVFIFFR